MSKRPLRLLYEAKGTAAPGKYGSRAAYLYPGEDEAPLRFDSLGEAHRWVALVQEEREGKIANLHRQVRIPLHVEGVLICTYVADFTYVRLDPDALDPEDAASAPLVVEDHKGYRTPEYLLKQKLLVALYGIKIAETGAPVRRRSRAKKKGGPP